MNQNLADLLSREPDPIEYLAEDQATAMPYKTGLDPDLMVKHGRLVLLACRHFTITKSLRRAKCRRCGEMIRAGYDYDAFRNLGSEDAFSWPSDPLRLLHEKTDSGT